MRTASMRRPSRLRNNSHPSCCCNAAQASTLTPWFQHFSSFSTLTACSCRCHRLLPSCCKLISLLCTQAGLGIKLIDPWLRMQPWPSCLTSLLPTTDS